MEKEFKIGDPVSDPRYGNGIIETIDNDLYHSVFVNFDEKKTATAYTVEGREDETDLIPMLYHGHDLIFEAREPKRVYVHLYWTDADKKCIATSITYTNYNEAEAEGLKIPGHIKIVEILK